MLELIFTMFDNLKIHKKSNSEIILWYKIKWPSYFSVSYSNVFKVHGLMSNECVMTWLEKWEHVVDHWLTSFLLYALDIDN